MKSRRSFLSKGALATVALMAAKPLSAFSSIDQFLSSPGKAATLNLFYANNSFHLPGNELSTGVFNRFSQTIRSVSAAGGKNIWLDSAYTVPGKTYINPEHNLLLQTMQDVNIDSGIESIRTYSDELSFKTVKLSGNRLGVITANADTTTLTLENRGSGLTNDIHTLASKLKNEEHCTLVIVVISDNTRLDYMELAQESTDIDFVMGVMKNSSRKISTVRNRVKNEVFVINQGGEVRNVLRSVEITFDENGMKNSVQLKNYFI